MNKKIQNARKTVVDGVKYDSVLESYFAGLLKMHRIAFEHQKTYTLQEKFRYNGEAIRAINIIVDFFLPEHNIIADPKGFATDKSLLKFKLLKKHLNDSGLTPKIVFLKNKRECEALILTLIK